VGENDEREGEERGNDYDVVPRRHQADVLNGLVFSI